MLFKICVLPLLVVLLNLRDSSQGAAADTETTTMTLGWDPDKAYHVDKKYSSYGKKKYDDPSDDDRYNDSYRDDDDEDDYKPSRSRKTRKYGKPDSVGSMNIYIKEKNKGSKKSSYKKYRFPVARYDRKRAPSFGQLISPLPWLPIFIDRLTKQTIIYSPTGGIICIPPIVNFFGKVIPVAKLILSGYASLVSGGAPLAPGFDVAPLVSNTPVTGPNVPKIDDKTGTFNGGVRTNYVPPRPADPPAYGERVNSRPAPQLIYSEPQYGAPAQQPVVPQYQPAAQPQYQPEPPQYRQDPPAQYDQYSQGGQVFDVPQGPQPNYPPVLSE